MADAVVALNASLYVIVRTVPVEFTAAELNTGAVKSTVELFVVTDREDNESESLPIESWIAALVF